MSAITNTDKIVTADMLQNYHDEHVAPFLGGNVLGAQSNFKNSDIYSTTERIVGCWTDGRPLYQKTVTGTTPSASGLVTVAPTTAREIIKAEGKLTDYNGWIVYATNYVEGDKPQTFAVGGDKDTGYKVWMQLNVPTVNRPYVLTIWYTKTTDAAGSYYLAGENDYSTDEKIIGKWIDGKNIYRRVVDCGNPPTAGNTKTITVSVSGVDKVLKCNYLFYDSTYQGNAYGFFSNIGSNKQGFLVYTERSNSNIKIHLQNGDENFNLWYGYAILEYTKS